MPRMLLKHLTRFMQSLSQERQEKGSAGWQGVFTSTNLGPVYMKVANPGWEGYPVWQSGLPALAGYLTYHVNVIQLEREIIWTGGLSHLSGLPHLPVVPHLHVNRLSFTIIENDKRRFFKRLCLKISTAYSFKKVPKLFLEEPLFSTIILRLTYYKKCVKC